MNLREIAAQIPHGQSYFRRHAARYHKIWESLPGTSPLTILDIGVGYGFLAAAMKQAGHRVFPVAFFYGKVAIRFATRRLSFQAGFLLEERSAFWEPSSFA